MSRKLSLLTILVSLGACISAQPWSGIIDPSRAIDWSNAGVLGGIPSITTQCGPTIAAYSGSAAAINSAISSCGSGQFVNLGAGTFTLSSGISLKSGVVLRGQGANSTKIAFTAGSACTGLGADVCIIGGQSYPGGPDGTANWTAGYARGATSITLSNTAGLVAGSSWITLDQMNDSNTDTGGIWVCETAGVCSTEGAGGTGRSGRAQSQTVKVTGISGNTVTISPGLYMPNWRSGQSPGAYWSNSYITNAGIENMTLDHARSGTSVSAGIHFQNAYNCWVKGVRDIDSNRSHVWVYVGGHLSIQDSYFYATQNAATESYGVEVFNGGDNLIQNNIFQHISASMIFSGSNPGTVFSYNYAVDGYYSPSPGWFSASNFLHSGGIDNILIEGNNATGLIEDQIHGTHHFVTAFRNYFSGWEPAKTAQTVPLYIEGPGRYSNFIGNVLGTKGYHTGYQCEPATTGDSCATSADLKVFTLGFAGNEGASGTFSNDVYTGASLMRWGNYDTVTNAVRWCGNSSDPGWSTACSSVSEVPSGLALYPNAVPASTALPNSFYLSSKPAWWGTPYGNPSWPANGPDVTGGNIPNVAGFANAIPAQLCFQNMAADPGYATAMTVSGATYSSGQATLTVGSGAANVTVDSEIMIAGVTPSGYNCARCVVTGQTATTVSYALSANPGSFSSGGTASWPVVPAFNANTCYGGPGTTPVLNPPTNLTSLVQ